MIAVGELVLDLYPAMVAVYLLDCVVRVGPSGLLLSRRLGSSKVIRGPRFFFVGALPSDRAYALAPDTLAFAPRGIFVLRRDDGAAARYRRESYDFVAYEETGWTLERRELRKGKVVLATFASPRQAEAFVARKRRLTESDVEARRRLIAAARDTVYAAVAAARRELAPLLRYTQVASFAFLATLFAALPISALFGPGAEPAVRAVALLAATLYATVVVLSTAVVRRMRRAGVEVPHAVLVASLLFPLGAAHASYQLTRTLAASADLLTAAALLLPRDDFAALARREVYGIDLAAADDDGAAWREMWEERRAALATLLQRSDLAEAAVRLPPPRSDGTARLWCPFCAAEYVERDTECAHCETPLVALA